MNTVEFKPIKGYEVIDDNLGSGSFGKTIVIKDLSLDEVFVCKKYAPQQNIKKEDFFESFKKEIKLMYNINHPNVVRVFTYYLYEESYVGYIIMEYIKGVEIDKWFSNYWMQLSDSNEIFRQLIEGFCCIEKSGVIHRDIRESNILISNNDQVKIIDFGLGKNINEQKLSMDSFNSLINRAQMQKLPNEFSEKKYTTKTDMFCLAELFERLLKKHDITDFKHNYILQKMLNTDPDKRYNSFADIIVALDKKDFKQLNISNDDKETYNNFIGSLCNSISAFTKKPIFESNISSMLFNLQKILEENCLNYHIENTVSLIEIFVKSPLRYYTNRKIDVTVVQSFYDWLISKDEQYQEIVIKNIHNRLTGSISVKIEEELPF